MISDALFEQFINILTETVWKRPELEPLRQPIEGALQGNNFKVLTQRAFQQLEQDTLPQLLDEGYIGMPVVQQMLADWIVRGQDADIQRLSELYADRYLKPSEAPDIRPQLKQLLTQMREVFATDNSYGPILLARDVQLVVAGIQNLSSDMNDVKRMLRELLEIPEIQAAVEQRKGTHIFLSYTRPNLAIVTRIRNELEAAGHHVWQDVSAIKSGSAWIASIQDGIERAYAVVTVVSHQSQESEWVTIEYLHAARREKQIVPIKIDNCEIPMMMLARNVVHGHPDLDKGLSKLLTELPPPTPQPDGDTTSEGDMSEPETVNRRQLEIDYLDRVLLEHSVWQSVYTPMAGVGEMRVEPDADDEVEIVTTGNQMETLFSVFYEEETKAEKPIQVERKDYTDILVAVDEMRQLVILGEPGSGKSTSLWRIAADMATTAKADPTAPLPVIVRLGALKAEQSITEVIQASLDKLAPYYGELQREGRLALLLDGLNEMPDSNRTQHARQVQQVVETWQEADGIVIVTCRRLDYVGELDLGIPEEVDIQPLDPLRIRQFVNGYITKPKGKGDELFWELAGEQARDFWDDFTRRKVVTDKTDKTFWLADNLPDGAEWGYSFQNNWEKWIDEREHPRSMLTLARNPFMLFMMTQVFTHEKQMPENRGKLFGRFVDFLLLKREGLTQTEADKLKNQLADLGYAMQQQGEGTAFTPQQVGDYLSDEQLYRAKSANILSGTDQLRFSHQLLQEYSAAQRLNREMSAGVPATNFFPPDTWWQPTGWEETTILLAGLYSDDTSTVIDWLKDAQPELTMRCITESGAHTPDALLPDLQARWLPRLTDESEAPPARAAIGRALGRLQLDNRLGVGLDDDGLPDIHKTWCDVPAGRFIMGSDKNKDKQARDRETPQHEVELPAYKIAKYAVTVGQYRAFMESAGYENREYWTEAGWSWKTNKNITQPEHWDNDTYNDDNQPINGVSWYEAYAFCAWLNQQYHDKGLLAENELLRLPTESEWEKAARGTDSRIYPYGNEYDPAKGNGGDTNVGRTSAVGIFPSGASPYSALDMSGNVYDWCLTKWRDNYEIAEDNTVEGNDRRVVRGGSFANNLTYNLRAAFRNNFFINSRNNIYGFRCCVCVVNV